jgi:membrane-bound lytic murein transglycosylase B
MMGLHKRAIEFAASAALVLACAVHQPAASQEAQATPVQDSAAPAQTQAAPAQETPAAPAQEASAPAVVSADPQARFRTFLQDFRAEALAAGIPPELYDRATSNISLNTRVEQLNLSQPEFVRPVWTYLDNAVTEARVNRGRDLMGVNAELFARLQVTYGIPTEVVTAIWGMETGYGANLGSFNLFEALATLAYDGPRAAYGRRQLIAALKIALTEGRDPSTMTGSWAGAFGFTQFVPTTFLERAVDGDGDGKRDLWGSPADALASTANYLNRSGWKPGEGWGVEVQLPADFAYENADPEIRMPVAEWTAKGVRKLNGEPLSESAEPAAIFLPAGARGPAFLVQENFYAILKYNFATSYALAVSVLSDRLKGASGVTGNWPRGEEMLSVRQRITLQEGLTTLGYDTGGVDGVLGRRTRAAIREFQKARGIPADGYATSSLLTRILNERFSIP